MTDRELMQQALEAMGAVGADWICEASHHAKKDQHKLGEPCPLQQRWHIAYQALRERLAQPEPSERTRHKMMIAMMRANWRSIDPKWKDDPELCHAMGYEAGYNDAVARRVEPRASGSGAGFESLPASPTWWDDPVPQMRREWQGLTDEEIATVKHLYDWTAGWTIDRFARAIEAKLKEKNT